MYVSLVLKILCSNIFSQRRPDCDGRHADQKLPKVFSVDGDGDDDVDSEVAGDVDGEDDQAAGT